MFCASRRKSSSSVIVSANSSTRAGGLARAATGMRPTRNGASHAMTAMSARTRSATDGPLHLDDDALAGAQRGRVHLGDRRRRQRLVVDGGEHLVERPAQVLLDDPAHDRPRLGRHLVAAVLALAHQLLGEQALARRDDLGELDVGGPEVLGGDAQPAGQVGPGRGAALAAGADGPEADGRRQVPRARSAPAGPGGRRRGDQHLGHRRRDTPRSASTRRRQDMAAGSTSQGASSLKAPTGEVGGTGGGGVVGCESAGPWVCGVTEPPDCTEPGRTPVPVQVSHVRPDGGGHGGLGGGGGPGSGIDGGRRCRRPPGRGRGVAGSPSGRSARRAAVGTAAAPGGCRPAAARRRSGAGRRSKARPRCPGLGVGGAEPHGGDRRVQGLGPGQLVADHRPGRRPAVGEVDEHAGGAAARRNQLLPGRGEAAPAGRVVGLVAAEDHEHGPLGGRRPAAGHGAVDARGSSDPQPPRRQQRDHARRSAASRRPALRLTPPPRLRGRAAGRRAAPAGCRRATARRVAPRTVADMVEAGSGQLDAAQALLERGSR